MTQKERIRSRLPVFASRLAILVGTGFLLLTADYVWSKVNNEGRSKFIYQITGAYSLSDLFDHNDAIYDDVVQLLGSPSENKRQPTLAETRQFTNDLPNRFEDVSRQLAAASDRDRIRVTSQLDSDTRGENQIGWRKLSLQEVLALRRNAKTQFSGINRALGIKSGMRHDEQFDGIDGLMEALATDWSTLNPAERKDVIVRINKQTAVVITDMPPIPTAYTEVYLHSVEPIGTKIRYTYIVNAGQPASRISEIGTNLKNEICNREVTRTILENGGAYEFAFHNSEDNLISLLPVTESECL